MSESSSSGILKIWNGLSTKGKKMAAAAGMGAALTGFVTVAVVGRNTTTPKPRPEPPKSLKFDDTAMKKSIFAASREREERLREEMERKMGDQGKKVQELEGALDEMRGKLEKGEYKGGSPAGPEGNFPPAPGEGGGPGYQVVARNGQPRPGGGEGQPGVTPVNVVPASDTVILRSTPEPMSTQEEVKKKGGSNYLSVSIIKATNLTGLDALVSEEGMSIPKPIMIHIDKPAILPNRVRKNIQGCFIIGEAVGSLATERAHIRTKRISCTYRQGKAAIEEDIAGWAFDGDGKEGLRGKVVGRFGYNMGMTLIAGFLGGMGEMQAQSAQSITTDSTGQKTQTIDSNQMVQAGAGKGLSNATSEAQKFYLNLAKQALPVIEVLPGKQITIVLDKGVELKVIDLE